MWEPSSRFQIKDQNEKDANLILRLKLAASFILPSEGDKS